jgi:hypothetical protein
MVLFLKLIKLNSGSGLQWHDVHIRFRPPPKFCIHVPHLLLDFTTLGDMYKSQSSLLAEKIKMLKEIK